MKRIWPLAALGLLAFLVFALFTLPASVVIDRLEPYGIRAAGVTGTAWNGRAQVLQIGTTSVGALAWNLHVLPLFTLRAVADIELERTDGSAHGTVSASSSGIDLKNVTAELPIGALPPQIAPGGWAGSIDAKLVALRLENGWPVSADGTIEVTDLTGPARKPVNIGSYRVEFPAQSQSQTTGALTGAVSDIGGPIQIAGTIQLKQADRSYLLEGRIATKPDAPPDFARSLEFLGPPDAQGRREFSLSGTM